jgi:hypothetical protein
MTPQEHREFLKTAEFFKVKKYLAECARILEQYPEYEEIFTAIENAKAQLQEAAE